MERLRIGGRSNPPNLSDRDVSAAQATDPAFLRASANSPLPPGASIADRLGGAMPFLNGSRQINVPAARVFGEGVLRQLIGNQGSHPLVLDDGGITASFDASTRIIQATTGFSVKFTSIEVRLDSGLETAISIRFDPPPSHFELDYLVQFGLINIAFQEDLGLSPSTRRQPPKFTTAGIDLSDGRAMVNHVLGLVRTHFYSDTLDNVKSGNKYKINGGPNEFARRRIADKELTQSQKARYSSVEDAASAAMNLRAHNCGELSTLSVHFLRKFGLDAALVSLGPAHVVCVASTNGAVGTDAWLSPTSIKSWPDHLFVCDPWANIACQAKRYPEEFQNKMEKWARDGKMIGTRGIGWESPNSTAWINRVLNAPTISVLR